MNKFYSLALKEVRPETRNAVSLSFDLPEDVAEKFRYKQGQHLVVRTKLNGEEVRRTY
jgi:ring-1,2-phenylacetyl-CoA epoxidase subunit PaaE